LSAQGEEGGGEGGEGERREGEKERKRKEKERRRKGGGGRERESGEQQIRARSSAYKWGKRKKTEKKKKKNTLSEVFLYGHFKHGVGKELFGGKLEASDRGGVVLCHPPCYHLFITLSEYRGEREEIEMIRKERKKNEREEGGERKLVIGSCALSSALLSSPCRERGKTKIEMIRKERREEGTEDIFISMTINTHDGIFHDFAKEKAEKGKRRGRGGGEEEEGGGEERGKGERRCGYLSYVKPSAHMTGSFIISPERGQKNAFGTFSSGFFTEKIISSLLVN
jgi:hypothetical protein